MVWRVSVPAAVVALAVVASPAEAFDAHGSARQVYATGLAPGARSTLTAPDGRKRATKRANPLGGVLFREREARRRLPRPRGRRAIRPARGDLEPLRAAERRRVRPDRPLERLRVPGHARRDAARD